MKKVITMFLLATLLFVTACSANVHKVGNGAQGKGMETKRQWYILFGLVPLNDVDTQAMAGESTNYTIKTEQSASDIILNIFTGYVTVYSRTVTVEK